MVHQGVKAIPIQQNNPKSLNGNTRQIGNR